MLITLVAFAGLVTPNEDQQSPVPIYAPIGLLEHSISENVLAGNVMGRRASYMFGNLLPKNAKGHVGSGLGMITSSGNIGLLRPTHSISGEYTEANIDGVNAIFYHTPGAEAPAEFVFYLPDMQALCLAEIVNANMHNLYTLRGAQVRDALIWSKYIDKIRHRFGAAQVAFGSHHWPRWGTEQINEYLHKHASMYRYLHDQTLRLANMGYTPEEIAEQVQLPDELAKSFFNRGYYGTVRHNIKAVYQRYLGWFNGNPSTLNPLPQTQSANHYVAFMGGAESILEKAQASYQQGEYRWLAQVLQHLVFADDIAAQQRQQAKELLAKSYEQLGYQAESGPWRNFYLSGAQELRSDVSQALATRTISPDMLAAMTPEMLFDLLAVRLNPDRAKNEQMVIDFHFSNSGETHRLELEHSVLRSRIVDDKTIQSLPANSTINTSENAFKRILTKQLSIIEAGRQDLFNIDGSRLKVISFFRLLDDFDPAFNIVTP